MRIDDGRSSMSDPDHRSSPSSSSSSSRNSTGSVKIRFSPEAGSAPTSSTTALPDQILENVLESVLHFLTSRKDRNAASLVCRLWYRVEAQTRSEVFIGNCYAVSPDRVVERFSRARAVVLKGRPRFADFGLVPPGWGGYLSPWVMVMSMGYPWLEKLCLKRMTVTDEDLFSISRSFLYFKELVLTCCDGFGISGIVAIVENCRQLRVLDLVENYLEEDYEDVVDWVSKFPQENTCLESLVFDCLEFEANFASLEALVARSPRLKRLRVNHHVSIGQLFRLMSLAPQLTHLGTGSFQPRSHGDVVASGHSEQFVDLVSAFAASKSLVCLSGFRGLFPEYLPALHPVCANLTYLNFSYADVTSEQLKPVISYCHNLQTFWVLDSVRDEGLLAVADTCKDLRELRVFPIDPSEDTESRVSDVGLIAISKGCRKLRSILYFCQCMTNAAVVIMSKNCPDLVVFRLCIMGRRRPDHITGEAMDDGFGAIVRNCKKLTRLSVSGLLTDKAFAYIGKFGRLVRTLSVAFAGDSDLGLRYVLEGCLKLQKLEIRDCPFGDAGLLSGLHQYFSMRFLWMSSCKLSVNSCKEVAQKLPQLVVEVIRDPENDNENCEGETNESPKLVGKLYMYRSLAGPRTDAPPFVQIL